MKYLKINLSDGLGNQKMQLFGAVLLAKMHGASLVEPEWADWEWPMPEPQKRGPFESLYDFHHFAASIKSIFNVDVVTRDEMSAVARKTRNGTNNILFADSRECWDVWILYQNRALKRKILDKFLLEFLISFRLAEANQRLINTMLEAINLDASGNPWHAIHMRTEKDWLKHSQFMRSRINLAEEEEVYVSPVVIRDKFYSTFGLASSNQFPHRVFIACDEKEQEESPFDIWRADTRLFHIKDILELKNRDNKTKSAINFEICLESPIFTGTSRSSFLRLAALTRVARRTSFASQGTVGTEGEAALPTYIYNLKSPQLVRRKDYGFYLSAIQCVSENVSLGEGGQEAMIRDLLCPIRLKLLERRCKGLVRWGARKVFFPRKHRA